MYTVYIAPRNLIDDCFLQVGEITPEYFEGELELVFKFQSTALKGELRGIHASPYVCVPMEKDLSFHIQEVCGDESQDQ